MGVLSKLMNSYIRLHEARHSHASLMLKQGVHPKMVQEQPGHALIQITLDTFSCVAPELQEAAAADFGFAPVACLMPKAHGISLLCLAASAKQ